MGLLHGMYDGKTVTVRRLAMVFVVATLMFVPFTQVVDAMEQTDAPQFISSIGKVDPSAPNGAFAGPKGIATDSNGNIFVVDTNNDRIQKFSANGEFIAKWGGSGAGNGQFDSPYGVAIDESDNVYITDAGNGRVQKFTNSGSYITQWGEPGYIADGLGATVNAADVTFRSPNGIDVADRNSNRIQKFTSNGEFILEWGTQGSGNGQFFSPNDVATDSDGNTYVSDSSNHRIQKFTSDGVFIEQWGVNGLGDGEFNYPLGITVDQNDVVYVSDSNNSRVQKFTDTGTYIAQWGSYGGSYGDEAVVGIRSLVTAQDADDGKFNGPVGIATGPDGSVYVVDSNNGRIQKFTAGGAFITKWGEYGTNRKSGNANGEFNYPGGAATDSDGNLYVADSSNHRIQKFSANGTFITKWGSYGNSNGQFGYPSGVTVGKNGDIYVTDSENSRIQKFSPDGVYISQWGGNGDGDGQMGYPIGIASDMNGDIYVADKNNDRIQKFSPDGTFITKWGIWGSGDGQFSFPQGVATDKSGNVYVADSENNRIQKFTSNGVYISQWGVSGYDDDVIDARAGASTGDVSVMANDPIEFNNPSAVSVDGDGNVYVADTYNGRIQKFTTDGSFLTMWGTRGESMTPKFLVGGVSVLNENESEFSEPYGITTDKDGNVYVVDSGNHRIQKFGYVKTVELAQPGTGKKILLQTPLDITVNSSNVVASQSIQQKDGSYQYPLGLVDFSLSVPAGSTQQINLTFETDLRPSDVVARKYHATKNIYSNLPGAEITETIVDGKHALQLTYSISDGGNLDDDGTVNGVIVDPVGLALGTAAPGAPNSGSGTALHWALLLAPVMSLAAFMPTAYTRRLFGRRNTTV